MFPFDVLSVAGRPLLDNARPLTDPSPAPARTNGAAVIGSQDLERQLALVQAGVVDPLAGLFGPGSLTWRIEREAILFLAAGRALLLQLAHPAIAAAVGDNSRALVDPL